MTSRSERYRRQNRIARKPKRTLLRTVLCALCALVLFMLIWTMPTEKGAAQASLTEDFSQSEAIAEEELDTSSNAKTTIINSSVSELNTPGVNGVIKEKSKSSKKKETISDSNSAKKRVGATPSSSKSHAGSSAGTNGSESYGGSAATGDSSKPAGSSSKAKSTGGAKGSAGSATKKTSSDKKKDIDASEQSKTSKKGDSPHDKHAESSKKAADSTQTLSKARSSDDPDETSVSGPSETDASDIAEVQGTTSVDEHDVYDYSGWGYDSYAAFLKQHPLKARLTYVRLCVLGFLSTAQPVGCTSCSRLNESVPEVTVEIKRPKSGQIFEKSGQGSLPQLVVTAPKDQDAFIKLKHEDGSVALSFYVRSDTTVRACVPVGECSFYYALGTEWKGEEELFGSGGTYAKSDRTLNFVSPLNTYKYCFGVENGNVTPKNVSRAAF